MKKLIPLLFALVIPLHAGTPVGLARDNVTSYLETAAGINTGFKVGNGQTIELLSGSTLTIDTGANFSYPVGSVVWTAISNKPTTLGGYGITDAQPVNANLTAIGALPSAIFTFPYFTGSNTAALATLTSFGQSLLADTTAGAAQTTLGLLIGSNIQAYSPTLTAIAGGTYAGNTNLTTLGTVTTGTWNAAPINLASYASGILAGANGGSGIANSNTETRGGNITFAGAFSQTFTATATTSVTVPTSGTLSTLANSEALTNKTVNGLTPTALSTGFSVAGGTASKILTVLNTLTLLGTDSSSLNIGTGGTLGSNAYTSTAYAPLASPTFTGIPAGPTASPGTNTTQLATTAFVIANTPSGVVTGVSIASANGFSGSSSGGTTPALTIVAGAITPTSVNGNTLTAGTGTLTLGSATLNAGPGGTLGSNAFTSTSFVPTSTAVNGHALSSNVSVTASDVGLGSVTNAAQTLASIVPNTIPNAAQVLVGNSGATAYAPVSLSGDSTMTSAGVMTNQKVNGVSYGTSPSTNTLAVVTSTNTTTYESVPNAALANSAITIAGTSTSLGGSITQDTITGLSTTGLLKRTGANTLGIAASGTDYAPATTGGSILYANGSGGFSAVTVNTSGLSFSGGTLSNTVVATSVTAQSMAAMRALSTSGWTSGQLVTLTQYWSQHDGGGGTFVWDSSDTTADNGGTVIQITGITTGRLHRITVGTQYASQLPNTVYNIQWFGAIADNSTDATPGIVAAYEACLFSGSQQNAKIYAPAGNYSIQTKCTLYSGLGVDPETGAINFIGDGSNASVFYNNISGTSTSMFDFGLTPYVTVRGIGIASGPGVNQANYLYLHGISELTVDDVRGGGLTGTFMNVATIGAWSRISHINTANSSGCQVYINGTGGVLHDFNLGTGLGQPCLMVVNCNALDIHDGQCSGGGPYISFAGAALTSNSSTFTITQTAHGFQAGDYICLTTASSHAGYVNRWRILSTTTNTITVASTANLGSDTVTFGALYCVGYFGGAQSSGNVTESKVSGVLWNTAIADPKGSCSVFLDGCSGGHVGGLLMSNMLCDYGLSSVFAHGFTSAAYDGTNSYLYTVVTSNATSFTATTCTGDTAAGSFVNGHVYCIDFVGSTNFTAIGASGNTLGVVFTATGAGSGSGTAANVATHSMKAGGLAHFTGGTYGGFWPIVSVTANSITCNTFSNLGTATVQPLESDILGSSVGGITLADNSFYVQDDFGGVRVEGANLVLVSNSQFANPAQTGDTGTINSVVISDGNQAVPSTDISIVGGNLTATGQSTFVPASPKNAIVVDGVNVIGLKVRGAIISGPVSAFAFTNSGTGAATPATCNLDTDYFMGQTCELLTASSGAVIPSQSQPSFTTVPWGYVLADPLGMWSAASPTKITVPYGARVVEITGKVHWSTTGVTPVIIRLEESGSLQAGALSISSQPNESEATVTSGPFNVDGQSPGQYFELQVTQGSGSSQTLVQSYETMLTLNVIK